MENAKKFFEIVEKHLKEVKHEQCKLTDDDITEMVKNYQLLYIELGTCYSYLRQILPSDDNLDKLKVSIENARKLWMEKLDISCTPKAHALFDGHAYDQHKRLGGIGDKLEDFVEKGHQHGIRDERRTWNIKNWEAMQRSQIRHTRRGNHPEVVEIIQNVHQSKKRKLKRLESGGESRQDETKRIKKEERNTKRDANRAECAHLFQS
jgi:hypothetical protein